MFTQVRHGLRQAYANKRPFTMTRRFYRTIAKGFTIIRKAAGFFREAVKAFPDIRKAFPGNTGEFRGILLGFRRKI